MAGDWNPQTAAYGSLADSFMGASSSDKPSVTFYPSLSVAQGSIINPVELRGPMDLASASSLPLHIDCEARNLPRGFDTLTYPGRHEAVASISGLHAFVIEDRSPLLAAAFETSRSGKRLHLDTLSPHTAIAFVRYLYTGSYAVSGDWEDVPTSILLHCKMYQIGHIYDLDMKQQAYVNILRQCEFGCSSPEKPVELCAAIDFIYNELSDREPVSDAIVQYCVSRCLSHKLHESFEFKHLAYNVRAFHQDLTKVCRDREYEDESATVIIQLPYKNFAPATYASSEKPGFEDLVHHFHGSDRFDDMATSKKRHLAPASDTSASPIKHQRVNVASNPSMKDLAFREAATQPSFAFHAYKNPASNNVSLPFRQRDASSTEMLYNQQFLSDAPSDYPNQFNQTSQTGNDAEPKHLKPYVSKAPDVLDVIKHAKKKAAEMKLVEMAQQAARSRDNFAPGAPPRHDANDFQNPLARAAFKIRHDRSDTTPEEKMASRMSRFSPGVFQSKWEPSPAHTESAPDESHHGPVSRSVYSDQKLRTVVAGAVDRAYAKGETSPIAAINELYDPSLGDNKNLAVCLESQLMQNPTVKQEQEFKSFVGHRPEEICKTVMDDAKQTTVKLESVLKEIKQKEAEQEEAEQILAMLAEQRAAKRKAAKQVVSAAASASAAPLAPTGPTMQAAREATPVSKAAFVAPKASADDATKTTVNDDSDADSWVEVSPEPAVKKEDTASSETAPRRSSTASDSDWEFC